MNLAEAFAPWVQAWAGTVANNGYKKGLAAAQNELNTIGQATDADKVAAYDQFLKDNGYAGLVGKNPNQVIVDAKTGYAQAQANNDDDMMNQYHNQAEQARTLGKLFGMDMNGLGADNTLEQAKGMLGGVSQVSASGLGSNLKYLGNSSATTSSPEFERQIAELAQSSQGAPVASNGLGSGLKYLGDSGAILSPEFQQQLASLVQSNQRGTVITDDMLKSKFQQEIEALAQKNVAQPDQRAYDNMRVNLISKGYDPRAVDEIFNQDKVRRDEDQLEEYIGQFKTPEMQNFMRIALKNPNLASFGANISPTPKDTWNVQVGRDNAAINHEYKNDTMERTYQYGQTGADNDLGRKMKFGEFDLRNKKDYADYTGNLKRELDNMSMQDRAKFLQAIGVDPAEMKQAFGVTPAKSNNQQENMKNAIDFVKTFQKLHENDEDMSWKKDPALVAAMQSLGSAYLPKGSGETGGGNVQINDYNEAIEYATDILMQNRDRGQVKAPKEAMIHLIRQRTGDMADNIINNINWKDFGY